MMKEYRKYKLLMLILLIFQVFLIVIYVVNSKVSVFETVVMVMVMLADGMVLDAAIVYLCRQIMGRVELEEKLTGLYSQRQHELDYGNMVKQHMDSMQVLCDDLEKQLNEIYAMVEQDNTGLYQEAERILKEMEVEIRRQRMKRYCEHDVINALLISKCQNCQEKGITLLVDCNLTQDNEIDEIDLCSIFGNLINAAVEVNKKYDCPSKQITIKADKRAGKMILRIEQKWNGAALKERSMRSIRKEVWCPEFMIVENICNRYSGYMEVKLQDEMLVMVVVM